MKNIIIFTAVLAYITITMSCIKTNTKNPEITPGDNVPEFEAITFDGQTVFSSSIQGNGCVLVFFNTWCDDCHRVLPVIQEWADEDNSRRIYLCVARGQTNDEILPFWRSNKLTMLAAGDKNKHLYNLFTGNNGYGVPVIYFIDENGICTSRILQSEPLIKTQKQQKVLRFE